MSQPTQQQPFLLLPFSLEEEAHFGSVVPLGSVEDEVVELINFGDIFKDEESSSLEVDQQVSTPSIPAASEMPNSLALMTPTNLGVMRNVIVPPAINTTEDESKMFGFGFEGLTKEQLSEEDDDQEEEESLQGRKRARVCSLKEESCAATKNRNKKQATVATGNVVRTSTTSRLRQGVTRGSWTQEEDEQLRVLVTEALKHMQKDSVISWTSIAAKIKTRSAKQCRERWILNLDPTINHEPFLPHEDAILITACSQMGPKWTKIKALLPGRTENSVKTRFKSLMRKANLHNLPQVLAQAESLNTMTSTVI